MKTMKIWRLALAMLAAFSLASCSSDDDNDKDITKEMNMSISAEPGVMYDLFDSMGEHPIEMHARNDRGRAGQMAEPAYGWRHGKPPIHWDQLFLSVYK